MSNEEVPLRPRTRRSTVTLSDVASAAGVSASTASRVLNGGKPVSAALDARVRKAAASVGYVSNAAASALRGRRELLAILTDELGVEALAELAIAAGQYASEAGLATTVASAGYEPTQQLLALQVLRSLRPHAIVLTGGWLSDPAIRRSLSRELKEFVDDDEGSVVVMGAAALPFPTVGFDDLANGRLIGRHVARQGGRSAIILAGPAANGSFAARAAGICESLRDQGVTDIETVHSLNESEDAEREFVANVGRSSPDMVLCVNDRLALGAYAALDTLGLRIGTDILVSGMDDLPVAGDLNPGLTTVAYPLADAGALVVELALEGASRDYSRLFEGEVITRGSTLPQRINRETTG